jgi:hypothetical protein
MARSICSDTGARRVTAPRSTPSADACILVC